MDFKPPVIRHINDVLPHIKDKPEITHVIKDNYQVLDYMYSTSDTFDNMYVKECRGIKFDLEGNLIARPFHKFHNINENEEYLSKNVDLKKPHHMLEKLDGSMVHHSMLPCRNSYGFRYNKHVLMTRMGETTVAKQAQAWLFSDENCDKGITDKYLKLFEESPYQTFIFEYVGPNNRIVIPYKEENLILTAVRYKETGEYLTYHNMKCLAFMYDIPLVQLYENPIEAIASDKHKEGAVIRFDTGAMVKMKSDIYVRKHRSKELVSSFKDLISLIINNNLDDILPKLDDDIKDKVIKYKSKLYFAQTGLAVSLNKLVQDKEKLSQKDFALYVKDNYSPFFTSLAFEARKTGEGYFPVCRCIQRNCHDTKKLTALFEELGLPIWENTFFDY